ncbi:hypothetical protein ACLWBD_15465 [Bdellovibrio sp. HCB117]|uniref:hypothetical protein n=1 Tax=Bdellovibrio sp. HCB117 TaxID=3394359 RepID=UPI0039B4486B
MENNLDKNLSVILVKLARPFLAIAFIATAVLFLISIKFLMEPWLAAVLTVIGTLLGFYSIWLTLEIYRISDHLSREQTKLLEGQHNVVKEVHLSVMAALKFQHLHDLRRKYDDSEGDDERRPYWNFIWRFESFDFLSLRLENEGWARIRILGSNNHPLKINTDHGEIPIYTVDVLEVRDCDELSVGRAYCWCPAGEMRISNNADGITVLNPSFSFTFSGLGPIRGGAVAETPPNFLRLKDVQSPSSVGN